MHRKTLTGCICCSALVLTNPVQPQALFTETTATAHLALNDPAWGSAFGDYDNDGRPDLLITATEIADPTGQRMALWHNEGNGVFSDQTRSMEVDVTAKELGGGALFGDYDNDGDLDLLLPVGSYFSPQRGRNLLLRNNQGAFLEVGRQAGLIDSLPTDNAIWLDYDRDGYLDLYTGNLASYPNDPTVRNKLYRNQGNGKFVDVTTAAGLDLMLHPEWGGSNSGIVSGDFDSDGWPDLFLGVFATSNRLFLNDGQGKFYDATTPEIKHGGFIYVVTRGDIDNDGDLDVFVAAGGGTAETDGVRLERSVLLLNMGKGQFLDVTEAVGLSALQALDARGASMADLDNDGDLDLVVLSPERPFLFLNNGEGFFEDQSPQLGAITGQLGDTISFGDYDLDGFLDVFFGCCNNRLFHNNGNEYHWLRVELVGTKSNRNGIGATLLSTAGTLRQVRGVLGGSGQYQDEMVAHFGLGAHARVDSLEIRWPSGQVDLLRDIPADQKIRVVEGSGNYTSVLPSTWAVEPPASLRLGEAIDLEVSVRPALFEPATRITAVRADLSSLGGPGEVVLQDRKDGVYTQEIPFAVKSSSAAGEVAVLIEQATSVGAVWTRLSRQVAIAGGTVVEEEHTTALPQAFSLSQNFPNPFNSQTVIRFALPASAEVELAVYNLAGQRVVRLAEGAREAGTYTVRWDGRDARGHELASGVYLYRLRAGDRIETRKLALVR